MQRSYVKSVAGRWGTCQYFEKDEYIGRSLEQYGEYNPDETEFILKLAEKAGRDRLVLDIGANIGAIAQALVHSGFRVEAFEPQPEVYELLVTNANCKCHNVALGAETGIVDMPRLDYAARNNFGGVSLNTTNTVHGSIKVKVERLDDYQFQDVGLMKIDVEGFEEQVLRGAVDTIRRCSPILYLEDDRKDKSESLHAFLRQLGYKWQQHNPPLFRAQNFFGKAENIWGKNFVSRNIVCVKA